MNRIHVTSCEHGKRTLKLPATQHASICHDATILKLSACTAFQRCSAKGYQSLAMYNHRRREVILTSTDMLTHGRYCQGGALSLDECYFEPVSSCSLRDAYGAEAVAAWGQTLQEDVLVQARKRSHSDRVVFNTLNGVYEYGRTPPQVCSVQALHMQDAGSAN
jgi:hypothetical protein